jgi:hypothetical protein
METIIEQPWAKIPFLRFIITRSSARPEEIPMYEGGRIDHHRTGSNLVKVTKLIGFGETLKEAQQMAAKHNKP